MIIEIDNTKVKLLGDPHLGKSFKTGVPLHRLGERERMVREQFQEELIEVKNASYHVCMGDLFDKRIVAPEVVLFAYQCYVTAASKNSNTTYIVLRGNHDASLDREQASSFDLFEALAAPIRNIKVVKDTPIIMGGLGFFPWHPFMTAREMVESIDQPLKAGFGHWDKDDFGQSNPNLVPTDALAKITGLAISGHVHTPEEFKRDGVKVVMTGSMQPYSFTEDRGGTLYVTYTLDQIKDQDLSNKCVRILLRPGEELPADLDCLQLVAKRFAEDEKPSIEVGFEDFDMRKMFEDACSEEDVKVEIMKEVWSKFEEMRR